MAQRLGTADRTRIARASQEELDRIRAAAQAEITRLDQRIKNRGARAREGSTPIGLKRGRQQLILRAARDRQKILSRARQQNITVAQSERITQLARQQQVKEVGTPAQRFQRSFREQTRRPAPRNIADETAVYETRASVTSATRIAPPEANLPVSVPRVFSEETGREVDPATVGLGVTGTTYERRSTGARIVGVRPSSSGFQPPQPTARVESGIYIPPKNKDPLRIFYDPVKTVKERVRAVREEEGFFATVGEAFEQTGEQIGEVFISPFVAGARGVETATVALGVQAPLIATGNIDDARLYNDPGFRADFEAAQRAEDASPRRPTSFLGGIGDEIVDAALPFGVEISGFKGTKLGGDRDLFEATFRQERRKDGLSEAEINRQLNVAVNFRRGTDTASTQNVLIAEGLGEFAGVGILAGGGSKVTTSTPGTMRVLRTITPAQVGGGFFEGAFAVAGEREAAGNVATGPQIAVGGVAGSATSLAVGGLPTSIAAGSESGVARGVARGVQRGVYAIEPFELGGDFLVSGLQKSRRRGGRPFIPTPEIITGGGQVTISPRSTSVSQTTLESDFTRGRMTFAPENTFTSSPINSNLFAPDTTTRQRGGRRGSSFFNPSPSTPQRNPFPNQPITSDPAITPGLTPSVTPSSSFVPVPSRQSSRANSRQKQPFRTFTPPPFVPPFIPSAGVRSPRVRTPSTFLRPRATRYAPGLASLSLGLFGRPTQTGGFTGAEFRPIPIAPGSRRRSSSKKRKTKRKASKTKRKASKRRRKK